MAAEGKGVLLKADAIAETFRTEIKSALSNATRPPKLVGILATSASPSKFYSEFTKKQCDALGVEFVLRTTGQAADESLAPGEGVEEAIIEANEDPTVNGIMVCSWTKLSSSCATHPPAHPTETRFTTLSLERNRCVSDLPGVASMN